MIVEGMQKVRPGMAVKVAHPKRWNFGGESQRDGTDDDPIEPTSSQQGLTMLSKFFLDRPVFAWVIAIILMVLGLFIHL